MDNRQRQQDEILALEAIFGAHAVEKSGNPDEHTFILHAPIDTMEAQLDLRFHLPDSYPSDTPPVFEWVCAHDMSARLRESSPGFIYPVRQLVLSDSMYDMASTELHRVWDEEMCRDVAVYSWVVWLGEYLSERWPQPLDPIPLPKDSVANVASSSTITNDTQSATSSTQSTKPDSAPNIFTGPPLEMKKSVFVAHVARVRSADDVRAVRDTLLQDKKIAQATHNILAYRITLDNGSVSQDNDDDGETAAGKRLGHLLHLLNAQNLVVVVTRWYGGTHLGPDRFKLINNAARLALDQSGLLGKS
ncbi:hypothetical protein IWW43_004814 [Coemansia sp. RSA 1935]|nr:hypothetical protein J3F82_004819 [Coemansia sp. RSA 637]KAJ2430229.1 hypothetical protein GGF47_000115 [Coemansia sp. RSA 2524]KAJ2529600.1 hypothetical protein IWW43_004814 [Coemansia sp. RSA 1935]